MDSPRQPFPGRPSSGLARVTSPSPHAGEGHPAGPFLLTCSRAWFPFLLRLSASVSFGLRFERWRFNLDAVRVFKLKGTQGI